MSQLPDHNKRVLKQTCEMMDQAIKQSMTRLVLLAHEMRQWLKNAKHKKINVQPMTWLQNSESQM